MTVNHSDGFPNWSQLNNIDEPLSTCNVTSCINAAQCSGFDIEELRRSTDPNKRPADDLYEFINSDSECLTMRDNILPGTPPNQLMAVLAFGLGKWLKSPQSVEWHSSLPLTLILQHIISGGCGILHGHYPTATHDIDHMNALVGVDYTGTTINSFVIDDPYGDYRKLYTIHAGNDIIMPIGDIVKYIKEIGDSHNKDIILVHRRIT